MGIQNIKWTLENQAKWLEQAKERRDFAMRQRNYARKRNRTLLRKWQTMDGDTPVGEVFEATGKEVQVMRVKADQDYLKRLGKWKGVGPRPRLTLYNEIRERKPFKEDES